MSIRGIQAILEGAEGDITLGDFMDQYQQHVIQDQLIKPNRAAWEQLQTQKYQQFLTNYPTGLFPPDTGITAEDMVGKYMATDQIKTWDELAKLANPQTSVELLRSLGFKTPIPANDLLGPVGMKKIRDAVAMMKDPTAEYAKMVKRYAAQGDLFPDLSFFAKPEDAYFEVLDSMQEFGVKQLITLAKAAGRDLPDFLIQFRIKIPTIRFRDHYEAVKKTVQGWKDRVGALKLNLEEELQKGETAELLEGLDLVGQASQHITNADENAYLAAAKQIEGLLGPALKTTGQ
jgi:hypothetical protein